MVVNKYLILGIISFMLIGISFSLNWNVINGSNSILIYGYLNGNQKTNINIQVKDMDGSIIWEGIPEFSSDYDTDTMMSGVFYKNIDLDQGKYIVKIINNGNSYSKDVIVSGGQNFDLKIIDISQNSENTTIRFFIDGNNIKGKYILYYKYGNYEKEISSDSKYTDEISVPSNEFGENTIVILKFNSTYTYTIFKNREKILPKNFELKTKDISIVRGKSGEFTFDIKNLDSYSINLNITYNSNLNVYGEQDITLQPNEEKKVSYSISVPRDFNDTPFLEILASSGNYNEKSNVNVNILPFEGFDLSTNFKDQYLPNDEINTNAIVKNIGDDKKNVQFSYEIFGNMYKYPYAISLNPGESFSFPVNILIPSDQTTDFDIKFFVNDEEFDKTIEVSPYIYKFSMDLNQSNINIMSGDDGKILISVENIGNIKENYKVSVNGWKYYTLSENKFSISPKGKKTIMLDIITNKNMQMGNYPFNISISNGKYTKYENVNLFVDKKEIEQSNISFIGRNTQEFSTNKTFNYTLKIKNNGIEEKEYLIKVSNFNITKYIELSPNETKEITINITPKKSNDYNFNITVFSNGIEIWDKTLKLNYMKSKITGSFIMAPKEVSIIGLIALSILGGAALGLYIGEKFKIKVNKEKAVVSNDYR